MTTLEELRLLREEVQKLRERVAVLESRNNPPWPHNPHYPAPVYRPITEPWPEWKPPFEVTCGDAT